MITPGAKVAMSILVHKMVDETVLDSKIVRCPEKKCPGSWAQEEKGSWATWSVNRSISAFYAFADDSLS